MWKKLLQNRLLTFLVVFFAAGAGVGTFALVTFRQEKAPATLGSDGFDDNSSMTAAAFSEIPDTDSGKVFLRVDGLSCSSCVEDIQAALGTVEGIREVSVNVQRGSASILYDRNLIPNAGVIAETVSGAGYPASVTKVFSAGEIALELAEKEKKKDLFVASVGDWEIPRTDFTAEYEAALIQYRNQWGEITETVEDGLKVQVLNRLIEDCMMLADIRNDNFQIEDDEVRLEIDSYLTESGQSMEDFREKIEAAGYSYVYYREKIARNVLITRYLENVILAAAESDTEKNEIFSRWYGELQNSREVTYYDQGLEELVYSAGAAGSCCD